MNKRLTLELTWDTAAASCNPPVWPSLSLDSPGRTRRVLRGGPFLRWGRPVAPGVKASVPKRADHPYYLEQCEEFRYEGDIKARVPKLTSFFPEKQRWGMRGRMLLLRARVNNNQGREILSTITKVACWTMSFERVPLVKIGEMPHITYFSRVETSCLIWFKIFDLIPSSLRSQKYISSFFFRFI